MNGRISSVVPVRSWQAGSAGCCTAAFSRCCRRMRLDEVKGRVLNRAMQTVMCVAATLGTKCKVCAGSAGGRRPNEPLYVTAARLRFLLHLNGHGGAAALERRR